MQFNVAGDCTLAPAARGYHQVDAQFQLTIDNMMDLGHESWVHLRTIGQGDIGIHHELQASPTTPTPQSS